MDLKGESAPEPEKRGQEVDAVPAGGPRGSAGGGEVALVKTLILHSSGSDEVPEQNSRWSLLRHANRRPESKLGSEPWIQAGPGHNTPPPYVQLSLPVSHLWMAAPQTDDTEAKVLVPNTDTRPCVQAGGHRTRDLSPARSAPRVTQSTGSSTDQ